MPYMKIQTNVSISDNGQLPEMKELLAGMSRLISEKLQKPERYVMVACEEQVPLVFAGTPEPAMFIELKSIGLQESATKSLSADICAFIERELGIDRGRVYIEFSSAPRTMWGWNGTTFG